MLSILYKDSMIQQIRIFQNYLQQIKESSVNIYSNGSNGSGFIYRDSDLNTYCLTAAHVIYNYNIGELNNSIYLSIYNTNDRIHNKILINNNDIVYNIYFDIAIIKINPTYKVNYNFSLMDSRNENLIGGLVYVIGNPLTLDTNSLSFGCLRDNLYNFPFYTNENEVFYESITVNASSYPGNSGGMILYITESNVSIIGMLQYGMINNDGTSSENFGGGLSSSMIKFLFEQMNGKNGEFKFPKSLLKILPVTLSYASTNSVPNITGYFLTQNFDNFLTQSTIITKINDIKIGKQIGEYNPLSILLEAYYSNNQQNVKLTLSDGTNKEYTISSLLDTIGITPSTNKFLFDNKYHYLL